MTIPDDLAAELPPPYEGEPVSLRQDIIDELSDHLHCALQRELLASGGRKSPDDTLNDSTVTNLERTAWQSVLTRFGNPAAIAARLWWDAMKERVMSQRIVTTVTAVAVAALCVFAVLGWRRVDADRRLVFDSLEANRDFMQTMTAANQELLSQFQTTQNQLTELAASGSNNPEWVPAEVIVLKGGPEGPPAEGVLVSLNPANNAGAIRAEATTDSDGVADLGIVRIGAYSLTATTLSGESLNDSVNIAPLKPYSQTLVAPAVDPNPIDAAVRVVWPDGFDATGVWVLLPERNLYRQVEGAYWQNLNVLSNGSGGYYTPGWNAISPVGTLYHITQASPLFDGDGGGFGSMSPSRYTWSEENAEKMATIRLPDASYAFSNITFAVELPADEASESFQTDEEVNVVTSQPGDQARSMETLTNGSPRELVIRVSDEVVTAIETFRRNQEATAERNRIENPIQLQ